jgi:NADH dehydrogenase
MPWFLARKRAKHWGGNRQSKIAARRGREDMAEAKRRVLILGGGHGGVATARNLRRLLRPEDPIEIGIVSRDTALVWHGLMPQIVSNMIKDQDALIPLRKLVPGVQVYPYEVEDIDLSGKRVVLSRHTGHGPERGHIEVSFDYLVLSLGSVTDLSRFPGLAEHGLPCKTIGDVVHLRNQVIEMLELASVEDDLEMRRGMLTFVVVGAGFAGTEICAEINGLVRDALRFYPSIDPAEVRVILLSHSPEILSPPLDAPLAARARRRMEASGVEVRLSADLKEATATAAILGSGEHIATRTIVPAVGVGINPLIPRLPVEVQRGRIVCDEYCRVPGWPGIYAVGDNAAVPNGRTGMPFPPTLTAAHAQGKTTAGNILAEIRGGPLRSCRGDRIQLGLLTKGYGVVQAGKVHLDGLFASLIWHATFLIFVSAWHRRLALAVDWLVSAVFERDVTSVRIDRTGTVLPMRFGAGEVILREGEPGSRFYMIRDGEVEVYRNAPDGGEDIVISRLGPGKYFGEVALLHGGERMASVRAVTDVNVVSIDRGDFQTLVASLTPLGEAIAGVASAREEETASITG